MRSRVIFYFLFIPLLLITAVLSYMAYNSFTEYKVTEHNLNTIRLSQRISINIENINRERKYSVQTFSGATKRYKDELLKSRLDVDNTLDNTLSIITKDKSLSKYLNIHKSIVENLGEVRTNIDTLSSNFDNIFNGDFHKQIVNPQIEIVKELKRLQTKYDTDKYIDSYIKILDNIEILGSEQAYLLYIINKQKKMSIADATYWEYIVSHDLVVTLDELPQKSVSDQISKLMEDRSDIESIEKFRASIWRHSLDAKYTVEQDTIVDTYDNLLKKLYRTEKIIYKNMKKDLEEYFVAIEKQAIEYSLAALFGLITMIFLIRTFSSANREKIELKKALLDMVGHLDTDKQKELDNILQKDDIIEVYRFLADTTKEAHLAKRQAIEAEKVKDLFLANMSHEIRTPLNGILGFTQLLKETPLADSQQEFLGIIESSSDNLLNIVNDVLDLSKIKADKMELESISFDTIETLNSAIEPHEIKASAKKVEYSTFIDPTLPYLIGDPTKLSQVMTNLIGNAMKFTDYQGIIKVSIDKIAETGDDVEVRFSVRDNGIGISKEQKKNIFQAFTQADISTTREFGGTGLGLAITSNLVERMGGKLELESEIGKGSEFYFSITLKRSPDSIDVINLHKGMNIGYLKPVGTPEKSVEINLKRYLSATGASIEEFSSMDSADIQKYDLVIADYSFGQIRENIDMLSQTANHLIVLTFITYTADAKELEGKVDTIIYKPLNITKINRALDIIDGSVVSVEEDSKAKIDDDKRDNIEVNQIVDKPMLEGNHILVVEDNIINQKLIDNILSGLGATIVIANNGQEAIDIFTTTDRFDIVFMDAQMPVMGGIEASQKIVAWEKERGITHTPIVALTANALHGDRDKYLDAGMDDYLSKPINIDKLKDILRSYTEVKVDETVEVEKQSLVEAQSIETHIISDDQIVSRSEVRNDILLYCNSKLVHKIYKGVLSDYDIHYTSELDTLLSMLEESHYDYVLIDLIELTSDMCMILNVILDWGVIPMVRVHGHDDNVCGSIDSYRSIPELKDMIKAAK